MCLFSPAVWVNKQWIKWSKNHFVRKWSITWCTHRLAWSAHLCTNQSSSISNFRTAKQSDSVEEKDENLSQSICTYEWQRCVRVGEHNAVHLFYCEWTRTTNHNVPNRSASKPNIFDYPFIGWFHPSVLILLFSILLVLFLFNLRQRDRQLNSFGKNQSWKMI